MTKVRKDAAQAETVLAKNKVDARALDRIKEAELGYKTACAKMEIGSPSVLLRSISRCRLSIDGTDTVLDTNEVRKLSVSDKTTVSIPGTLDIEVTAGSSIEGLARKVDDARQVLDVACAAAAVAGPDEARKAYDERQEALRDVENKALVEKENLRDILTKALNKGCTVSNRAYRTILSGGLKSPLFAQILTRQKRNGQRPKQIFRLRVAN